MKVYRYSVIDLDSPKNKNNVYSYIGTEKRNLKLIEESFDSTEELLDHDRRENH